MKLPPLGPIHQKGASSDRIKRYYFSLTDCSYLKFDVSYLIILIGILDVKTASLCHIKNNYKNNIGSLCFKQSCFNGMH